MSESEEEGKHRCAAFLASQEGLQSAAEKFLAVVYATARRHDKQAPHRQVEIGAGLLLDVAVLKMRQHLSITDKLELDR